MKKERKQKQKRKKIMKLICSTKRYKVFAADDTTTIVLCIGYIHRVSTL